MAVTFRPKFSADSLRRMVEDRARKIEVAMIMALQKIGEECITDMRTIKTYEDRTSNLKNSGGYVILQNGKQIGGSMKSGGGAATPEALAAATAALEEAIGKYPRGLVLIVVAGMEYAAAVESKGFDVLTASSKIASEKLKKAMARIASKTERMS